MGSIKTIISFTNRHVAGLTIWAIVAVLVWTDLDLKYWKEKDRLLVWDVKSYYAYLPAALIYHDFSLNFYHQNKEIRDEMFLVKGPKGIYQIITTYGQALLYSPFFLGAHAYAILSGDKADGYSRPYRFALMISCLFYVAIGLYYLKKFLLKYYDPWITAMSLIVITLGTNLYYYSTYEAPMTHAYNFALIAAFLYFTTKWYAKINATNTIITGFLIGLITLVRPVNLIILLFFIFWGVTSFETLKERIILLLKSYKWILLMILVFFILWIPQFIYWKYISGSYLFYSYSDQRFFFNNPQIISSLFSYRKGLFLYFPLIMISFIGIPFLYKRYPGLILPVALVALINVYVLSSWCFWWFGGGFGPRSYIDTYAVLAIPFAGLASWISKKKLIWMILFTAVTGTLVWFNFFQTRQYYYGAINWTAMTKEAYWDSFLRKRPTKEFWNMLRFPDSESAKKGLYYVSDKTYEEVMRDRKKPEKQAPSDLTDRETYIRNLDKFIRTQDRWFQQMQEKAAERGITVDSMIRKDAIWLYEQELLKNKAAKADSISGK